MEIEPVDVEKVAAENPQSRFRIVENANLKPGVCALCGSPGGDGRQFVDFGKTMDWYGAVYFCTWCTVEAAKLLGLINPAALKEILSVRSEHYQKALYENAELRGQLNAAMVLLRNCTCDGVALGDRVDSGSPEDSDDAESNSDGAKEGNSDSDESGSVEGSNDVPATSDDDKPTPPKRRRTNSSAE